MLLTSQFRTVGVVTGYAAAFGGAYCHDHVRTSLWFRFQFGECFFDDCCS